MTDCDCGDVLIEEFWDGFWVYKCYACGQARPMTNEELDQMAKEWGGE